MLIEFCPLYVLLLDNDEVDGMIGIIFKIIALLMAMFVL